MTGAALRTLAGWAALQWRLDPARPLIGPPPPSPIVADPTFLPPDLTPDGRWHLYAHSVLGIHHFVSGDGAAWRRAERVARNAMRPFLFQDVGGYLLFFERVLDRFPLAFLPGRRWRSRIEAMRSPDLRRWDDPVPVLEPSLDWHRDASLGEAVSNPCLVAAGGGFRLYYSAGLVPLADCGFNEPRWIGMAEAERPTGPFRPLTHPLLGPEPAEPFANLAAGAIKVIRAADGWVGFQNGISWDPAARRSSSQILLRESPDGLEWTSLRAEPVLAPSAGWMAGHVYALDVREHDGRPVLFFNARSAAPWWRGVERIGRMVARPGV
jgi:hypothetical protein